MNKSSIGIFDSGIGGLSVVKEIKKLLPNESIIFLADKANFPYGEKTTKELKEISQNNVKWLLGKGSKIIVVACNTATVNTISFLRKRFSSVSFVGMEPAVKPASKISKKGVIVLSSPKATKSKQVSFLIKKHAKGLRVFNIGSLELVKAVEGKCDSKRIKNVLKSLFSKKVLNQADVVVLGCTHFPLIKKHIQSFVGKRVKVIDSGEAVARRVKHVLQEKNLLSGNAKPKYEFLARLKKNEIKKISL